MLFISITPRSLAPKFACTPITCSPIPCSLIDCYRKLTPWYIFPSDHLLLNILLAPTHLVPNLLLSYLLSDRLIALPLILEKFTCTTKWITPNWSSITLLFFCWLSIDSHCWPQIYISHQPGAWSTSVVTGLLLSNLPLIFEKNPCTCSPQFIDSWSILNYLDLLMLVINWFSSWTPYIFLPPTHLLVFWCRHCSYAIKNFSDFRKYYLNLNSIIDRPLIYPSTIDRPLIDTLSPCSSSVDCW